jgi:hypothetical protein
MWGAKIAGYELELAFDSTVILLMGSAPIIKPLKMFRLPPRNCLNELKGIQKSLNLSVGPIFVEKYHPRTSGPISGNLISIAV